MALVVPAEGGLFTGSVQRRGRSDSIALHGQHNTHPDLKVVRPLALAYQERIF
jgi:hypothetical protein